MKVIGSRLTARIFQIALWPLAKLDAVARRANRKTIRSALRDRSRPLFLFALLRFPAVSLGALVCAVVAVLTKDHSSLTWGGLAVLFVNKLLVLANRLLDEVIRVRRALRVYRRFA
jgi:hypothetical protein